MTDTGSVLLFTIVSFALALVLIMQKDTIPPQIRKPLALLAIFLVSCSFFLIFFSLVR